MQAVAQKNKKIITFTLRNFKFLFEPLKMNLLNKC